ncbi:spore germination protein KB [Thermanaeromonas toyohensis ToBE]|uniref:Spore germination protein KB n=1 Tax=Thermanaeromonas toyohensis ToBE TaxID=698762 RepID=A0A1W1VG48_9FIRM|nr:endospore germination permease [Thermanaeromonas toyohensis]SMB92306.1 spore germination protein KB [Thermanaeromonas toyohensis ToBE]
MREEGRISSWQFFMLIMAFLIGTSTLIMPVGPAKQDAWISYLLTGVLSIGAAYFYTSLGQRFPRETPFQYAPRVLGKILGTFFNILFLWYAFHLAALLLLNFSELYVIAIMVTTPLIVFIGIMAILAAWAVRSGLEALARLAELLTPFLIVTIIVLNILTLATPKLPHWENLLPIMAEGPLPILRGILPSFAFPFGETVFFLVLIPFLTSPRKCHRPFALAVILISLLLTSVLVRNIIVLGPQEASRVNFPSLTTIQLINIGDFLQRMDPLIIFIWTFGVFLKLTVVFYVFTLGTAQVFGLQDYRFLVFPTGLLLTFFAPAVYENFHQMLRFAARTWPFYFFPGYFLYPALLLLVAKIRDIKG